MAAMVMLDIVVVGTENRHAHNTGKFGEYCVADAVQDIDAVLLCNEARHLVPGERDLEVGNFAVVGGMRLARRLHTDLTPTAGKFQCNRLLHIERMGALAPYCVQRQPSLDRHWLALLGRRLIAQDNEEDVGNQLPIDWLPRDLWWGKSIPVDRSW